MKVGIIGGGQLGMMLAEAANKLNVETVCLEPKPNCPASNVTSILQANYNDLDALNELSKTCDVITYEFENVPVETLHEISKTPIFPGINALAISQDRLKEKRLFDKLNIPTTHYAEASSLKDLQENAIKIGFPCVIKTRRMGYDGKGQVIIHNENEIENAFKLLNSNELILENKLKLDTETSIISVRNASGEINFYPLIENKHINGILDYSISPYENSSFQAQAETYAQSILEEFNYIGVLTVEFFVSDGKLIANEIAPRVHNSGHLTIEGSETSQFENHIRAITNIEIGKTKNKNYTCMKNITGKFPDIEKIKKLFPNARIHLYNKSERPGRKIGHITFENKNKKELITTLEKLSEHVTPDYK